MSRALEGILRPLPEGFDNNDEGRRLLVRYVGEAALDGART